MLLNAVVALLCGVFVALPSALAAITITDPSPSTYWVQGASNVVGWSGYSPGDLNPVTITITNPSNATLNGYFSIAENVDLSKGFYTVTNVTLRPASGYVVNFVTLRNLSDIIAQSQPFDVKPPGTAQASGATPTAPAASATATSPSGSGSGNGNGNGNGTSTRSASGTSASSTKKSDAVRSVYSSVALTLGAIAVFGGLTVL